MAEKTLSAALSLSWHLITCNADETGEWGDAVKDQFPAQFGETRLLLESHTSSLVYSHLRDFYCSFWLETTARCRDTSMEETATALNLVLRNDSPQSKIYGVPVVPGGAS